MFESGLQMLNVDFHCHTIASVHGMNTIEEMLRRADKIGLSAVALTDHCPGLDNTLWIANRFGEEANWKGVIKAADLPYFKTFLSRYSPPEELKVKLFKGIECNILENGKQATDIPASLAGEFDLIIASLHPIPALFKSKDQDIITERYLAAMEEPLDVIGHPFQRSWCPSPKPFVRKAAEKGIALELNNASLLLEKSDVDKVTEMLILAKQYSCGISLASDAHATNELAGNTGINKMLEQTGFPSELLVNDTLEKAESFIQQRKEVRERMVSGPS